MPFGALVAIAILCLTLNLSNLHTMKYLSIILITLICSSLNSQPVSPVGIYYLENVMETASGFKIDADSTFEFSFLRVRLRPHRKGNPGL